MTGGDEDARYVRPVMLMVLRSELVAECLECG